MCKTPEHKAGLTTNCKLLWSVKAAAGLGSSVELWAQLFWAQVNRVNSGEMC